MKLSENQIKKLCGYLEKSLNSVKLSHIKDEEGNNLSLVDLLSVGDTIQDGKNEINNIVDEIFFKMVEWELPDDQPPASLQSLIDRVVGLLPDKSYQILDLDTKESGYCCAVYDVISILKSTPVIISEEDKAKVIAFRELPKSYEP